MTAEQFIKGQLAQFAYLEGYRYGGSDNMLAVAFVIRNRAKAGWHGGDWLQIIDAQVVVGFTAQLTSGFPNLRDENVKTLLRSIDDIYSGLMQDKMSQGAFYYAELSKLTNVWFRENIVRSPEHPKVADVGPVSFFK